jgi:O-antigen/teichoic acid export membrane protein
LPPERWLESTSTDVVMASETEATGGPSVSEPSRALGMMGRFGWGLGDQVLSSATNFLLGLLVARAVSSRELGAFSLVYAIFTLSLGGVRAIAGELLVVRHSAVSLDEWRRGVKAAAGTALMAGLLIGGGCLVASAIVGGSLRILLAILGICLPGLLVQDVARFGFFARGRGNAALVNDLVWAIVMFGFLALMWQADLASVAWFTLAWAGAGLFAAFVGLFQIKVVPSGPISAAKWLREHRALAPRFASEFAVSTGVSNLTLFAIGSVAGLGSLGRLRAGQIALGPLTILFGGAALVATPEGVRLLGESPRRLVHGCRWISVVLALGVLAWGSVVLFVPRSVGELLLRANWDGARSLLAPLLIGLTGSALAFGAWTGLRSLAAAKRSLRARYIDALSSLLFGVAGAYVAGATGAAWGYALAGCLRVPNAWWQFSRSLREYKSMSETDAAEADVGWFSRP